MGASLLDQVLAETVDPAYQQAADARAARRRAAVDGGTAPEPERRYRGRLVVALVMAIAGLLVAVTYDEASAGAKGRHQVREALLGDIDHESKTADALATQLDRLHGQVDRTRGAALDASAVGQDALGQLAAAEQAAAAVPVSGPGLMVTLANATPNADSDPVGGNGQASAGGLVRDSDLQLVANALWAAGAEAISIDGQRLGPTTTIRLAGEAVLVDFWPVTNPYRISAIGDPNSLATRFLADPGVEALAVVAQSYGLRFDFAKENQLSLPAATPSELHYARPVMAAAAPAGQVPSAAGSPSTAPSTALSTAPSSAPSSALPTTAGMEPSRAAGSTRRTSSSAARSATAPSTVSRPGG